MLRTRSIDDRAPRRRPFRLALVAVALVAVALVAAACGTGIDRPDDAGGVSPAFEQLDEGGFSGVALVDHGGDIEIAGFGFADRDEQLANGPDTVFDIGSITKQFTATAILRLEMDDRLSVGDPVGRYLPALAPEQHSITLHQLLTHTAGLPDGLGDDYATIDRDGYVELVADTPLRRAPGQEYEYSNVGYSLLAAVIETVTEQPYEVYLREALFDPAAMESTGYVLPDWDEHVVAIGYDGDRPLGRPHEQNWADDGPYWHLRGNGGLLSTAEDMHRWHDALLGDRILDADAKAKLYGRHTTEGPGASTYYGYGWAIFPTPFDTWMVTHNGGNGIFFADFLRFLDEDVTIFIATNSVRPPDETAALDLAQAVFDSDLGILDDVAGGPVCGLQDRAGHDVVADFPDTEPGATARQMFALLADPGADDASLRSFIEQHVSSDVVAEATTEELVEGMRQLQEELGGLRPGEILQEDQFTYHAIMTDGTDGTGPADGTDVVVSVRMGEDAPTVIDCVEVMT